MQIDVRRNSNSKSNLLSPPSNNRKPSTPGRFSIDADRVISYSQEEDGKYEVLRQLGRGSFGSCKLVKHSKDNVLYAVKVIKYDQKEFKLQAKKEIDMMTSLCHPYVIMTHDVFVSNDLKNIHIVMTYCDSGDFNKLVKNNVRCLENKKDTFSYTGQQVLKWFCQVCLGLQYLHENRILHRDIKGANIFLYESNKYVRIGDFGLAKKLDSENDNCQNEVGTASYISPEMINGKGYSFPSDVWSLGCVLYELLTLTLPFEGETTVDLVRKIGFEPPPAQGPFVSAPKELWAIVIAMLEKDPEERITIEKILATPLMRRVGKYVIENYKPTQITSRQRRDELGGLQHQYKTILDTAEGNSSEKEEWKEGGGGGEGKNSRCESKKDDENENENESSTTTTEDSSGSNKDTDTDTDTNTPIRKRKRRVNSIPDIAQKVAEDAIDAAIIQIQFPSVSSPMLERKQSSSSSDNNETTLKAKLRLADALEFSQDDLNTSLCFVDIIDVPSPRILRKKNSCSSTSTGKTETSTSTGGWGGGEGGGMTEIVSELSELELLHSHKIFPVVK
ncbi:hypothetical protein ScalyP_jg10538 [Parmales sp. scaly parma]|nr:hypothetical protein ScalyP_jg10538 [Parmales sp. scaly parma]